VDLFSTNPTNCPNRPNHLSPVYKLIGGHFCLYSIYCDDPTNWAQSSPNYFSVSHSVVIFVWAQYVEMAHNNHHARLRRQTWIWLPEIPRLPAGNWNYQPPPVNDFIRPKNLSLFKFR
jgi:hypothetical protein